MNPPVALITGGCRGIGLGIARSLASAGFDLALTGLRAEESVKPLPADLEKKAKEVKEKGGKGKCRLRYFQNDLADIRGHAELLVKIEKELGPVCTLILNAGIAQPVRGDLLEMRAADFDTVMGVNLRGNFFLAAAVAKQMLATPAPGHFLNIQFVTSVSAQLASPERAAYCISKAAASMAASLYALRLAPHGIAVYEIRPGIIATDMTAGVKSKYDHSIEAGLVPARRWGQAEDIGEAAAALALGKFSFGTGCIINLDGGLSIQKL